MTYPRSHPVSDEEPGFYHCVTEQIGSAEAHMLKAADLGQRWMKGVSRELALKKLREQPVPW